MGLMVLVRPSRGRCIVAVQCGCSAYLSKRGALRDALRGRPPSIRLGADSDRRWMDQSGCASYELSAAVRPLASHAAYGVAYYQRRIWYVTKTCAPIGGRACSSPSAWLL